MHFGVPFPTLERTRAAGLLSMSSRASQQPPNDPPQFQVLNEIGIIDQLSKNRATQLLAPDLNMSQFIVLNHFARLGGEASLVELARRIQVTKGAMTNTVGRLRDKGLLAVSPDPTDGRARLVSLTAAGRLARDRAVKRLVEGLAGLDVVLSEKELSNALVVLRKLREWFDQRRAPNR